MHLAVEPDTLDHFAAVGFERAAVIVEWDAGGTAHQPVGDHGGHTAREVGVVTVLAPTADHVVALGHLVQQERDADRVVLQVGVHGDDHIAARVVETGGEGRSLSEIAPEGDDAPARIAAVDLAQPRQAAIRAAVVDDDHLVGPAEPF